MVALAASILKPDSWGMVSCTRGKLLDVGTYYLPAQLFDERTRSHLVLNVWIEESRPNRQTNSTEYFDTRGKHRVRSVHTSKLLGVV